MNASATNRSSEDQASAKQEPIAPPTLHEANLIAQGDSASRAHIPFDGWSLEGSISVSCAGRNLSNGLRTMQVDTAEDDDFVTSGFSEMCA